MISIVLGSLFGDEGKGAMVNHLARTSQILGRKAIVIRFSGGPQAGHTVVQNGVRHVFSHVGAGTLSGAATLWSEHCLFEPGSFMTEVAALKQKGFPPEVYVDDGCQVITPYDRYANQTDIKNLSDGSCGQGIGATMRRMETSPIRLTVADLYAPSWVLDHKLNQVRDYYGFKVGFISDRMKKEIELFRTYIEMYKRDFPDGIYNLHDFDDYIFEGSQGLLLDREIGLFPHVTYAHTTSKNAWKVMDFFHLNNSEHDITTYYVTRSYLTRHGSGPMGTEHPINLKNNEDETNILNKYQGQFRTGPFNLDLYKWAIHQDVKYEDSNYVQVVTCMDQLTESVPVVRNGQVNLYNPDHFKSLFPEDTLFSYGPEFKLQF